MEKSAASNSKGEVAEKEFVSLDFSVHSALAYLAARYFLVEALQQIWYRTRQVIKLGIRKDAHFSKVVEEHARIIDAIKDAQRKKKEEVDLVALSAEKATRNRATRIDEAKAAEAAKSFDTACEKGAVKMMKQHLDETLP